MNLVSLVDANPNMRVRDVGHEFQASRRLVQSFDGKNIPIYRVGFRVL